MPSSLRETDRRPTTTPARLQPSNNYRDKRTEFLGFLELLDELGAAPMLPPRHPFASRLWLAPLAVLVVGLISMMTAATRQSQRFAAPSRSAIANNRKDGGEFQRTSRDASVQFEQSTFTYASSSFGLGSDSSSDQSRPRQADQFAGDFDILFSRAEAGARFVATTVSHSPTITRRPKIESAAFAEHNAIVRPDPGARLPQSPSAAIAEESTNGVERSADPPTGSYVEAKVDASRPSNSVVAAVMLVRASR